LIFQATSPQGHTVDGSEIWLNTFGRDRTTFGRDKTTFGRDKATFGRDNLPTSTG